MKIIVVTTTLNFMQINNLVQNSQNVHDYSYFFHLRWLDTVFKKLSYNNNNQLYLKEGNDITVESDKLSALAKLVLHVTFITIS